MQMPEVEAYDESIPSTNIKHTETPATYLLLTAVSTSNSCIYF